MESSALVIVDVQNDFARLHGALRVPGGYEVVDPIVRMAPNYGLVIATQDWHPLNHVSFKTWPMHCVQNTRSLWQYDYMGAAEYEWGAVPEALQKLAKADKLGVTSIRVPLKEVPPNWRDKSKEVPEGEGEVFILGPMDDLPEISERVIGFATNSYPENVRDSPRLDSALRPFDEWDGKICGWLELDNGYMFFTDREMFEGACALFGIAVGATL